MNHGRWLASTFLLLLAALCAGTGAVMLGISIASDPGFPRLLATPYGQVQDYAWDLRHADCDIVIYGDSSAMTSDDPATIESQTHLKTCNISQTQPIVVVTGTLPVDLYLERNRRPRYLVIQVAPEIFYQPHSLDKAAAFDPMTLMLRHHPGTATTQELLRYPRQTLRYVSLVLQDRYMPNHEHLAEFKQAYSQPLEDYYRSRGLLTFPDPAETKCGAPKPLREPADFGWIDTARLRYSALGIKLLVLASPVPDCDAEADRYRRELTSHLDDAPSTLALSFFNNSDRHFTKAGSAAVSVALGRRIERLEDLHAEAGY